MKLPGTTQAAARRFQQTVRPRDYVARSVNGWHGTELVRQVACLPGLLDAARTKKSAAKFDALMPRPMDLREAGRKALVFSQFTSLLGA